MNLVIALFGIAALCWGVGLFTRDKTMWRLGWIVYAVSLLGIFIGR